MNDTQEKRDWLDKLLQAELQKERKDHEFMRKMGFIYFCLGVCSAAIIVTTAIAIFMVLK